MTTWSEESACKAQAWADSPPEKCGSAARPALPAAGPWGSFAQLDEGTDAPIFFLSRHRNRQRRRGKGGERKEITLGLELGSC